MSPPLSSLSSRSRLPGAERRLTLLGRAGFLPPLPVSSLPPPECSSQSFEGHCESVLFRGIVVPPCWRPDVWRLSATLLSGDARRNRALAPPSSPPPPLPVSLPPAPSNWCRVRTSHAWALRVAPFALADGRPWMQYALGSPLLPAVAVAARAAGRALARSLPFRLQSFRWRVFTPSRFRPSLVAPCPVLPLLLPALVSNDCTREGIGASAVQ